MDLKDFKKVGQTKSHTIFEHPEGHIIHVAHSALKPSQVKEAKRIPKAKKMADGGSVGSQIEEAEAGQVPQIMEEPGAIQEQDASPTPQQTFGQQGLSPGNTNVPSDDSQNPFLTGTLTEKGRFEKGLAQQTQGLQEEASATGEQGQREAQVLGQGQQEEHKALADYQSQLANINQERQNALHDYANNLINPNHFLENQGTGQKVATAIGLLLGGLGSGGDPSRNPALTFLNQQIDRDVQSQVANSGIKHNMVSALAAQTGDLQSAVTLARVMRRDQVAYDLQKQAALMKSPQAQAIAQQHSGQLMTQSASELGSLATQKAALSGNSGQNLPATLDPAFDRRVDVGGAVFHAPDKETANKVRPQLQALDELQSVIGRIDQFNKSVGPTTGLPTQASGQAQSLNREAEAATAKVEASGGQLGRLVDKFKDMTPVAGTILPSRGAGRSKSIHDFIAAQKAALIKENLSTGPILPQKHK